MDPKPSSPQQRWRSLRMGACAAVTLIGILPLARAGVTPGSPPVSPLPSEAVSWKDHTISPVANPFFHEDAVIRSELRPVFVYHNIDDSFLGGGQARLYAMQIRYALTDRLAFIATQDGWFDVDNDAIGNPEGWMDLALGFKYALIDDEASQFILTPGFTFKIPTGDRDVFQGRGGGEWDLFVAAQKGFGDFHLSGNLGLRLPNNRDENSTLVHYSLMADWYTCRWFIPFVAFNAFTVVDAGNNIALNTEGYDVINFGAGGSQGVTQGTLAVGFRSRIFSNVDLGLAYEKAVIEPHGLTEDRFTLDVSIRF